MRMWMRNRERKWWWRSIFIISISLQLIFPFGNYKNMAGRYAPATREIKSIQSKFYYPFGLKVSARVATEAVSMGPLYFSTFQQIWREGRREEKRCVFICILSYEIFKRLWLFLAYVVLVYIITIGKWSRKKWWQITRQMKLYGPYHRVCFPSFGKG
jgi:hypothetical protein